MQRKKFKLYENETLGRFLEALKDVGVWMEIDGFDHDPIYIRNEVEHPEMEMITMGLCELLEEKGGVRFWVDDIKKGGKKYIKTDEVYERLRKQSRKKNVEKKKTHLTLVK